MSKLKYILIFELKIPSEGVIIKKITDIKDDMHLGIMVALRSFTKVLSSNHPADEFIENNYSGDALRAASGIHQGLMNKINSLVIEIENFLKLEKEKIK